MAATATEWSVPPVSPQDPKVDRFAGSERRRVALRRATRADADAVADVFLASFKQAYPDWPPVHTDDEFRSWIAGYVIPELETWVAIEADGSIVGFMALDGGDLDQLYLRPDRLGRGLGSRFVELAKQRRPDGLALYTFQVNARARQFYARHGFEVQRFGDGDSNEERQPDTFATPGVRRGLVTEPPRTASPGAAKRATVHCTIWTRADIGARRQPPDALPPREGWASDAVNLAEWRTLTAR